MLLIDETSLPMLLRWYFEAGDLVAKEVADVESREPLAENDVPPVPVALAEDDDKVRLNGSLRKGASAAVVEAERRLEAGPDLVDEGNCEVDAERGERPGEAELDDALRS